MLLVHFLVFARLYFACGKENQDVLVEFIIEGSFAGLIHIVKVDPEELYALDHKGEE